MIIDMRPLPAVYLYGKKCNIMCSSYVNQNLIQSNPVLGDLINTIYTRI